MIYTLVYTNVQICHSVLSHGSLWSSCVNVASSETYVMLFQLAVHLEKSMFFCQNKKFLVIYITDFCSNSWKYKC